MASLSSDFHSNLLRLVKKDGKSEATIAKLAGINKTSLHNWLSGVTPAGLEGIEKLAEYFGVSSGELIGRMPVELELKISGDPQGLYEVRVERK